MGHCPVLPEPQGRQPGVDREVLVGLVVIAGYSLALHITKITTYFYKLT